MAKGPACPKIDSHHACERPATHCGEHECHCGFRWGYVAEGGHEIRWEQNVDGDWIQVPVRDTSEGFRV